MIRAYRHLGTMLLAAATLAPLAISGCAARVYDGYHSGYHHWNDREERAYRMWLAERRYEYREYARWTRQTARVLELAPQPPRSRSLTQISAINSKHASLGRDPSEQRCTRRWTGDMLCSYPRHVK